MTTAEQRTFASLSRDTARLSVVQGPKGKKVHLGGGFQSAAVARRAANGALQAECFDEHSEAEAFLQGARPSARQTVEVQ